MWWVRIYARRWLGKYMGQIPEDRARLYMDRNRLIYFALSSLFFISMWRSTNINNIKDKNKENLEDLAEYASTLSESNLKKGTVFNFNLSEGTYEKYELEKKEFSKFLEEKELIRKDTQGKFLATLDHPDLDEELLESLE